MRILIGQSLDPYFNLASEEYLRENCTDGVFMLVIISAIASPASTSPPTVLRITSSPFI